MAKLSTTDIFGELKVSLNAKVTGDLTVNGGITTTDINFLGTTGTNSRTLLQSFMADNDCFRILVGGTASNSGFVELATADDGAEPIYVRQYTGVFTSNMCDFCARFLDNGAVGLAKKGVIRCRKNFKKK